MSKCVPSSPPACYSFLLFIMLSVLLTLMFLIVGGYDYYSNTILLWTSPSRMTTQDVETRRTPSSWWSLVSNIFHSILHLPSILLMKMHLIITCNESYRIHTHSTSSSPSPLWKKGYKIYLPYPQQEGQFNLNTTTMNTSTTTRTRSLYALPTRSQLIAQLKQFQQQPHHKKSNLNNINLNNINLNSINLNNSNPSQVNLNNSNPSQVNPNNSNMSNPNQHPLFDVIVIGGGCVGSGIALEASHSLKVALFEMEDFGSGTSSKSTKLLHGGVRYLRKALNQFDLSQFKLVKQALHDRFQILNHMAPHLTNTLQIITPLYEWSEFIPTYFLLKLYDWMAFPHHLAPSYLLSASQALEFFPMLKHEQLKGAMVYHDGQFDDARLNLALIQTAIQHGVVALNRFKVIRFLFNDEHGENDEHVRQQDDSQQQEHVRQQDDSQQQEHDDEHDDSQHNGPSSLIKGVVVRDELTREVYSIRSKVVINAAGHFADEIRLMENDQNHHHHQNHHPLNTLNTLNNKILELSMGIHIVLDGQFCPPSMHQGLLIPKTRDHRVIFLLPYLNHTLVGTTDSKLVVDSFNKNGISNHVQPREEDIQYLLDHVNEYFNVKVTRQDVKAVWAGIRPLSHLHNNNHNHNNNNHNQQQQQQFVKKNIKLDTASISREHAIYTSPR